MASGSGSGLRFRLAGFPVAVPLNTLLGVAIIAWLWLPNFAGGPAAQQWVSAIAFAVALLASILVHELAHAVTARRYQFPVHGITLWAFGGYTQYQPVRNTPGREAAISAAGPAATALIALVAWGAWQVLPGPAAVVDVVGAIAIANALVAVFNMLPGLPLDGGGVLSAAVWKLTGSRVRGQRAAAYTGMALAGLIVAAPLLLSWRVGVRPDLVFVLVSVLLGAFLFVGARSALQQADRSRVLAAATAREVAVPAFVVPPSASVAYLDAMLSNRAGGNGLIALVGEPATGLRGYVLPEALNAVPEPARGATGVLSVTRTVAGWGWVPADAPAEEALATLHEVGRPVIVFDAEHQPIGVLVGPRARPAAG